ncbi:tyrosine-protein phosphatase non-receptor type substrate 1-like [Carcharodon carcharias]|uniref:tyrosine-protein phosphatase non-receptor type substrate 1-like n=1 Tax=Carcharodon carcharias TaxID=13397 RepID=UPI001B7F67F0|nr:tyrosine-protein phosphatase non-receptor type substrate 1-like [Carcharodon carcharias]
MTPFRQGSAEIRLLNVNFQDSGVYYCSARVSGRISNGNGTELIVYVPPTPVKITRVSSTLLKILCTTAGFFPKEINLTWYKNDIEITTGMKITEIQNEGGLYHVSSFLNLPEAGLVYTCQVSHISLESPANDSYTVRSQGWYPYTLVTGCTVGGLIILVLAILVICWRLAKTEGTEITENIPNQLEEQVVHGEVMGSPPYAALNHSGHGNALKSRCVEGGPIRVQAMQDTGVKLTYASLDFTASQKSAKRKQKKIGAEYAGIKINKPNGESFVVLAVSMSGDVAVTPALP